MTTPPPLTGGRGGGMICVWSPRTLHIVSISERCASWDGMGWGWPRFFSFLPVLVYDNT